MSWSEEKNTPTYHNSKTLANLQEHREKKADVFNPLIINHVGTSFFFLCLLELKIHLCDWFYYNLSMFIRKWKVFYLLLPSNLLLSCFFSRFMNCIQKAPHFCNVAFLNPTGDF